jgi:drug/metabolite transporter (DMT)-like permease
MENPMTHQMRYSDWILLLTLSLLWGGSFFFAEIALREMSPLAVVWARVAGAALMLLLILRFKGIAIPTDMKVWGAFMVMGILNNVIPFSLIVWGQVEVTGSLASVFNATTPLFTIVLAQFLTADEKINRTKISGLLLGFLGVVVMIGSEAFEGISATLWAQIAILVAAVSYGLAAIWGRRFANLNPMVTATGQVTCSSIVMTPLALGMGFPNGFIIPGTDVLFALAGIAFLCTVVAYILYFRILATSGATNLMLVTFLIPVSAILLGSIFLSERLEANQIAGMIFILSGLIVIDGRILRSKYSKTTA